MIATPRRRSSAWPSPRARCCARRRRSRARPGRNQARPRRRARVALPEERGRVREARERQARRQGEGRHVRLEPAGRRLGDDPEAEARHARHGAAVDGDELAGRPLRRVRDALHREEPRPHGEDREGDLLGEARARGREEGPQGPRGLGERRAAHHEQQAADQGARRPGRHQAARARGQVAREDVPGVRRQPQPDEVLRAVHRAADGRDGRAGEPVHADLLGKAAGGAEVPVAVGPRVHARLPHRRQDEVGVAAARRAQDPRGHGEGDAGVRVRAGREGRRRPAGQDQGRPACR